MAAEGRLEPEPGRLFRRHVFRNAPEGFGADAVLVADLLQRLQEADEIDDAFARHQPLVVPHFFRRAFLRIGEMEVNDPRLVGGEDVGNRPSGVIPVPDVEDRADVRTGLLCEPHRFRERPDERVARRAVTAGAGAHI